ncbi:MAG: xanthine dehydrogenase family protein [Anaerolineales bacterium]|nr:xanthine dehydrogenase family protein [Anaerolineales bacterium]
MTSMIGTRIPRLDGVGKVTGETLYPADIDIEGQLWLKIRYSDRVHARVVAMDTTPAEAYPGVVAVFTAKDVPVNEYGLTIKDQPVLCGPGSTIEGADIVRCLMDNIAIVVAESAEAAEAAAQLIIVEYEDLPAVFDPEVALADGAPQLHTRYLNNTITHYRIRQGDLEAAWQQADVVVEGVYQTGYQEHAFLQPEAGLSYIDEAGRVTVVVSGQWVHEDQEQIYHALNLPPEQVRIIYPAIGGAFGGREDMSVQIVLALAAWKLQRPIKTVWSREESIQYHHKRHPVRIYTRWGATREGKVVAVEAKVIGDGGAYNYTSNKVMGNAHLMVTGPYELTNVAVDTYAVCTNNIPCGAFRGFGGPQGAFAAENQMNKLAAALGLDPVEVRMRNLLHEGSMMTTGTVAPPGVTIPEVVETCAAESGYWQKDVTWERKAITQPSDPSKRRGIGFACAFKNIGFSFGAPENCWATIELYGGTAIEEVIVRTAGAEVGQGSHTAFVQMTAEAVGVPVEQVRLISHDTSETQNSGSASASRLTFMTGNAIRGAAEQALQKWQDEERPAKATYQYRPPATTPLDPETGYGTPNFAYGYVAEVVEVEVDIETGIIKLERVVCANDVGKAMNRLAIEGQIEGAVVQAQGYALMEHLISHEGRILNPYLSSYLIPTVYDIPREVKSIIIEIPTPIGPWGGRGMAEMPFLPLAPAITAAVHDATGVWMDEIPLTPDRVVAALRKEGLGVI